MLNFLTIPPFLLTVVIFFLRVCDMSLDTLRVMFVLSGRRPLAWILGFFQSALWVVAITSVISNLDNWLNIISYAAGFATGNVVGMFIYERLPVGHAHLRIISSRRGSAVAEAIRSAGYAATELSGRGKDGTVMLINSSVRRKDINRVRKEVFDIDPESFITVEEVRPLHRGFWRA
jgi:uncharacterized protein YebE (UPF0316 family)